MNALSRDFETAEAREALLAELRRMRDFRRRSNREMTFADVRAGFPDVARLLFRCRDLGRTDLRGADLRGLDFRGSDLSGCEFAGARVAGARFERAKAARAALRLARDWPEHRETWSADAFGFDDIWRGFERDSGERFSFSPLLPEVVILDGAFVRDAARLDPEERRALEAGRLALAVGVLTEREANAAMAPDAPVADADRPALRSAATARVWPREASLRGGLFGLPRGTRVRLPSHGLYEALARAEREAPGEPRPLATDLAAADLGLGRYGREFVALGREVAFAPARPDRRDDAPTQPTLAGGAGRAALRPLFLLGEG